MTDKPYPTVAADDFARRFSMRAGGLMWLLGAGWRFRRRGHSDRLGYDLGIQAGWAVNMKRVARIWRS